MIRKFNDFIVNEEKEYKGMNIEDLNEKELNKAKRLIDYLVSLDKKKWDSLSAQKKHDTIMKGIKMDFFLV